MRKKVNNEDETVKIRIKNNSSFLLNSTNCSELSRAYEQLKQSKIFLEESATQMKIVLDTMSELVAYQDLEHKLLYVNRASAESVGKTIEELAGEYCYNIWGDGKIVCKGCPVEKAVKNAKPETGYIQTPDGRIWLIKGYPVKDDGGKVIGAMEVTMDITEMESLKKKMSETDRNYKFIIDNISDIVFQQDMNLKITYISPSVEKIAGYSVEEVLNMSVMDLMTPESYQRGIDNFTKYYEIVKNNPDFDIPTMEYEYYAKDGRVLVGEMKLKFIFDEKGNIIGMQGVIRDITKRKELENQLILSQKMEALGRLAGGIAHDFNNLLTVIMGYTDIALMRDDTGGKIKSYFEEIRKTSKKATDLVSRLLLFSKKQIFMPKLVNINELIENNRMMFNRAIVESIKLEIDFGKNIKKVKIDPTQMEQVLMNIIVNAKDAMPYGGLIKIVTRNETSGSDYRKYMDIEPGEYVLISISDTGCGMTEEIKRHIFDPFFTTKKDQNGTGLGLSTVFGIIQQSNGYIFVESEEGKGTTFKIYLPAYNGIVEEDDIADGGSSLNIKGDNKAVLVVEDENVLNDMVSEILEKSGYRVIQAGNGLKALEILKDNHVDFIISDVVMPEMDGKELFRRITSEYPGLKFLFMSGYTENEPLLKDIKDSKVNFIMKPFTPQELLIKIKEVLGS